MNTTFVPAALTLITLLPGCSFKRPSPALRSAQQSERAGNLEQALSSYAEAAFVSIPSTDLPDINRSKILSGDLLKKEIGRYFTWITGPRQQVSPDAAAALEGITRCAGHGRNENAISDSTVHPLSPERYLEEWNSSFFAPKVKIDPSHASLASGNHARGISLLVVRSAKSYTYEINLINTSTVHGTKCILYPESSVRLYAPPGEYLLICRSTVIFPSEEIWRSGYTPIPLTIPQESSLVTMELRTSVPRKTK